MKNMKKTTYIWAITLVIAGLMITSAAVGVTTIDNAEKNREIIPKTSFFVAAGESQLKQKIDPVQIPTNDEGFLGTDFPVFSLDADSQNPGIATDGFGSVLVISETVVEDTTSVWGRWSTDSGENWADESEIVGWQFTDAFERPKLDYLGREKTAWGTLTPGPWATGDVNYVDFPDMTDPSVPSPTSPDGWTAWHVDWGPDGYDNMDSIDVACYGDEENIPSPEFFGVVAITGDADATYVEDDTMMFSFFVPGGQVSIVYFYNMQEDVMKMSSDVDQDTGKFYMVMEYENHATNDPGTVVNHNTITSNEDWWQSGWGGRYIEGFFNPDTVASNGHSYIVGEVDNGGQKDIVCYHSANNGASYTETVVSEDVADEVFPSVSITEGDEGDDIVCSYMREGDLYVSVSEDGGETWEEADDPINDESGTVVEQYSGASLGGPFAAWTDDRNSPTEIYFDTAVEPKKKPILDIISISGGIGVTATIKNIGEAPATGVESSLTVTGGILGLINKNESDTVTSLAIDAEASISSGIIFGLGAVEIVATVSCAEGSSDEETVDGTQIIIFTKV